MAETTEISWCDATINLWWGCSKVSPGCVNCYADSFSKRWGKDIWGKGKPREDHRAGAIKTARKLERQAANAFAAFENWQIAGAGFPWVHPIPRRPRVFSASMSDWLDDEVPVEWLADLLNLIRLTPHLDWLLLTKRPEKWEARIREASTSIRMDADTWMMAKHWLEGTPPDNVWIGTTVEDQKRADERIPALLEIPARVRFLSCEPLLEPVKIDHVRIGDNQWFPLQHIHWVIVGGESGNGFRPFNPDWARSLRDQCKVAGVAFHMKQMGGMRPSSMPPIPDDLMIREYPKP
jgi:protein gp37